MSRKTDLEQHIHESYSLVREYEAIVQTSSDPKEKARCRRAIEEQWELIKGYLTEYGRLAGKNVPADIAEIAVHFAGSLGQTQAVPGAPSPAPAGPATPGPDLAVVRDLLLAAFTADDLRRLFLYADNADLRPLIQKFGSGDGLAVLVDKTIQFCTTRGLLPDLLREVKRERPRQYARFVDQLSAGGVPPEVTATPAVPPAPGGATYSIHIEHAHGLAIGDGAQVVIATEHDPADRADEADEPAP